MAGKARGALCAIGIAVREWLIVTNAFPCSVIDSARLRLDFSLGSSLSRGQRQVEFKDSVY